MYKQILILLIIFVIPLISIGQGEQRYSVDKQKPKKHYFHISIKHLFKPDLQKKADKKKEKELKKAIKAHKKAVKKYQKQANSNKQVGTGKSGWFNMKKNRRHANRVNDNKPRDPWIIRIFK